MPASTESLAYVQKMFLAYFGRPVAPSGQEYYAGLIDQGNVAALQDDFWNSRESQSKFGELTTESKVIAVFQQLFGRDPAMSGLFYWTTKIDTGEVSLPAAALTILNSASGNDLAVFNAKLSVAEAFTKELDTVVEIEALKNNLDLVVEIMADVHTTADAQSIIKAIAAIVSSIVSPPTPIAVPKETTPPDLEICFEILGGDTSLENLEISADDVGEIPAITLIGVDSVEFIA